MEWIMLNESKKLFPHWLDKHDDSNFTKHLKIINNQQLDIRHKLKTIEWSRLLNKPLQIHKEQTEPHKWKIEFEVNVPRLKKVNIYKNPTIVNNQIVRNSTATSGYYVNGSFYENKNTEIVNLSNSDIINENEYQEEEYNILKEYSDLIEGKDGKYYYDLISEKYYKFENNEYLEYTGNNTFQNSLIYSESFIDNYSHFFRYILYEDNSNDTLIEKYIPIEDDIQKYKTNTNGDFEVQKIHSNVSLLYYNLTTEKYCILNNTGIIEIEDENIIYLDCDIRVKEIGGETFTLYEYYYMDNGEKVNVDLDNLNDELYYIFTDYGNDVVVSKIPFLIIKDDEIVVLKEDDKKYKLRFNHFDKYIENDIQTINTKDNGKFELFLNNSSESQIYFNITNEKYCILKENSFEEILDDKIIYLNYSDDDYYYIDENDNVIFVTDINDGNYYIVTDVNDDYIASRIPLIETEDVSPMISNDVYVLEVITWNDYHFLKGFPEIDFIDYNNNNIIDNDEKTYDNLIIEIEKIGNVEYLTFRVHQFGIKLIKVFKDDKLIHEVDFVIDELNYPNNISDNFGYVYNYMDNQLYISHKFKKEVEEVNLDVDEYVWRLPLSEEDKIYDANGNFELKNKYDLEVTYYSNPSNPNDSEYDKILRKTYVCEDSIFYHDVSLDMIGKLFNVPRHVFRQPFLETYNDKIDYYSKTYPSYCNFLNEDDYHYQKRLEYYINNYNKIYFPCLELWKYFNIDSDLINRKVIVAEQNYSYMRTLKAEEDKYINELGKNRLESTYMNNIYDEELSVLNKPILKARTSKYEYEHNLNGILIDDNDNYIKDIYGTPVRIDYEYKINENNEYVIKYNQVSKTIYWYNSKEVKYSEEDIVNQITLTDSLKVVPNTRYQLRFCVKEYPHNDLKLRLIYKNNKGDVRNIDEYVPLRKDYDESKENNELIYSNYQTEWNVPCEYICTDFLTIEDGQNIEICLESKNQFKISDITLQRITINHFDSEYMKTTNDYNSCVYDLYANYNDIPSNIKYDNLNIFNKILNRSLPLTRKGYFNFAITDNSINHNLELSNETNIYINNLLDVESGILSASDTYEITQPNNDGIYEHIYKFNKYVKTGDYEIIIKPYYYDEEHIVFDLNIEIDMIVYIGNNYAVNEKLDINIYDYYVEEEKCFKIPFKNKSDSSFNVKLYRNDAFGFKNFKLIRKSPLTMEELTK